MTATSATYDLRYPIGRLRIPDSFDAAGRAERIELVERTPDAVSRAVKVLSDSQLDTPYREGGWTVRQVVHHLADSHINAYTRFKFALTESSPTIKPYDEAAWAALPDSTLGVDVSLELLAALHRRWVTLLHAMSEEDFQRRLRHPVDGERTLDQMLAVYAWHGPHHVAHVTRLAERSGW